MKLGITIITLNLLAMVIKDASISGFFGVTCGLILVWLGDNND